MKKGDNMSDEKAVSVRTRTAVEIRQDVNLLQDILRNVMKRDTHYGVIPGCVKPTLYKAGSEKILSTFRISIRPIVEDLSTPDEARFRVVTEATHIPTGEYLGSGIGEASSSEEKYMWRATVCDEEWQNTPETRRRLKYKKSKDGHYTVKQVRTNVADVANTVLKMAKKRSQVDVTLTTTAASDIFVQDMEDVPEEMQDTVIDATLAEPPLKEPQEKAAPPTQPAAKPSGKAPADKREMFEMRAKFPSKCGDCGEGIPKDAPIFYNRDTKTAYHNPACPPEA